jgi:hypothetical protein
MRVVLRGDGGLNHPVTLRVPPLLDEEGRSFSTTSP